MRHINERRCKIVRLLRKADLYLVGVVFASTLGALIQAPITGSWIYAVAFAITFVVSVLLLSILEICYRVWGCWAYG